MYPTVVLTSEIVGQKQQLDDIILFGNLIPSSRVVVVSNYTKTLDLLEDLCVAMGYTFCRLDGHTPTGQRQRLVDSFNSAYSQNFLFLLSSKAGGVGLNLVGASHLVLYDIDWNPANDIQVKHLRLLFCLACLRIFWVVCVRFC